MYLIVGGKTYDEIEFYIHQIRKGPNFGRFQYRHKTLQFFGPIIGYALTRWVFTVSYEEGSPPMSWEVTIIATIPTQADPKDYDDFMEEKAKTAVNEYINRYAVGWTIELGPKGAETIKNVQRFDTEIICDILDLRRQGLEPNTQTFSWTEKEAKEIGGLYHKRKHKKSTKTRKKYKKTKKSRKNYKNRRRS